MQLDWPNVPLKSPRLFLIKKMFIALIRSLFLSARLPSPRSSAQPPDCRPCLPDAAFGHQTVGPASQERRTAASEARRPSASLPCCVDDAPLPPARRLKVSSGRCLRQTPHADGPSFSQVARRYCDVLKTHVASVRFMCFIGTL